MIKIAAIIVPALLVLPSPAHADGCETDVRRIDQALDRMELSEDEREQISEMNTEAGELCKAGQIDDAAEVIAEAKAMLNLD